MGFLVVGHTHKDIDAYFNYLSKLLKQKNTYVLTDLMKAFMDSQKSAIFVLELIQEVANFKSYVRNFHHDGTTSSLDLERCTYSNSIWRRMERTEVGLSCPIRCFLYPHSSTPDFDF